MELKLKNNTNWCSSVTASNCTNMELKLPLKPSKRLINANF